MVKKLVPSVILAFILVLCSAIPSVALEADGLEREPVNTCCHSYFDSYYGEVDIDPSAVNLCWLLGHSFALSQFWQERHGPCWQFCFSYRMTSIFACVAFLCSATDVRHTISTSRSHQVEWRPGGFGSRCTHCDTWLG